MGRYASEGIKAACDWAYKGVDEGSTLEGKLDKMLTHSFIKRGEMTISCFLQMIISSLVYQ